MFVSPEIAKGIVYSKEVDVWALGCFAFELATGSSPFHNFGYNFDVLFQAIATLPAPRIPEHWSPAFADFIDKCLIKDKDERWTVT